MSSRIVLCILISIIAVSSARVCNVSPDFWCDTPEIQQVCNTQALCASYNQTIYGQKVKLTLLYESLCPYCAQFILEVLAPAMPQLTSIMEMEWIPYGNANERNDSGTWSFQCQHGPEECLLNKYYSCALYYIGNDTQLTFDWMVCMENQTANLGKQPAEALAFCYAKHSIPATTQKQISTCQTGAQGIALEHQYAVYTDNVWPTSHEYVPWILINGVSTFHVQNLQGNLISAICTLYQGPLNPDACQD